MVLQEMRIADPTIDEVANEMHLLAELLPLKGARVLELGCGKAEKTRIIAEKVASIHALEVDEIQLAKNRTINDLPNVVFKRGGAESIPVADADFDLVLMFKSLHHVPMESMDAAFSEIHRVLKPGGLAYISEPVYAGAFNDILKLFHDEKQVREAAFAATQRAVESRRFELVAQKFFLQESHFDDFDQFDKQILKVTHTQHNLPPELYAQVRTMFESHMTQTGADFSGPIRVDLLRKNG